MSYYTIYYTKPPVVRKDLRRVMEKGKWKKTFSEGLCRDITSDND